MFLMVEKRKKEKYFVASENYMKLNFNTRNILLEYNLLIHFTVYGCFYPTMAELSDCN